MTTVFIIPIVLITLSVLLVIVCGYLLMRNERVHRFRVELINQLSEADAYYIHTGQSYNLHLVNGLIAKYSYDKMFYSFKPLKLKRWFSEDEIKLLYPTPNQSISLNQ